MGTDIPDLTAEVIDAAFRALDDHEVRRPNLGLLRWSTERERGAASRQLVSCPNAPPNRAAAHPAARVRTGPRVIN